MAWLYLLKYWYWSKQARFAKKNVLIFNEVDIKHSQTNTVFAHKSHYEILIQKCRTRRCTHRSS